MEFSIINILSQLNVLEIVFLFIAGAIFLYTAIARVYFVHIFLLTLGAALVGAKAPIVDTLAVIVRYVSIFMILIIGLLNRRYKIPSGLLAFLGYVSLGIIFLFRANIFMWQFQRSILLLAVTLGLFITLCNDDKENISLAVTALCLAALVYSAVNFVPLIKDYGSGLRFTGVIKAAPTFAMSLGSLLPFTVLGILYHRTVTVKSIFLVGFLIGFVTLALCGQRTGAIGGMIGIAPLLLYKRKTTIAIVILVAVIGIFSVNLISQILGTERVGFLRTRYNLESGLSDREYFWDRALREIEKNPILGKGTGAAETVVEESFHNTYLEVWYNTGIVGVFLYIASIIYAALRIIWLIRETDDDRKISFLLLSLGSVASFAAMSIVESIGAGASNLSLIIFLAILAIIHNEDYFSRKAEHKL